MVVYHLHGDLSLAAPRLAPSELQAARRFINRDVWDGDYRNPLTLNRWNYVLGNPVNYSDPSGKIPCFSTNIIECLSLFGFVPDYNGIWIVNAYKSEFENQESYITASGLHSTTIAAALAVQSQWINSPWNQIQRLYAELKKVVCMPDIPWLQKYLEGGLGYAQASGEYGDPDIMANSIKAMTERIKPVVAACIKCKPKDRLIAAAMGQNTGFGYLNMQDVRRGSLQDPPPPTGIKIDWAEFLIIFRR